MAVALIRTPSAAASIPIVVRSVFPSLWIVVLSESGTRSPASSSQWYRAVGGGPVVVARRADQQPERRGHRRLLRGCEPCDDPGQLTAPPRVGGFVAAMPPAAVTAELMSGAWPVFG
jgi:hypothetical protein